MFKKTFQYRDLDGNPVEETYYFAMSKAELVDLMAETDDDMQAWLERIIESKDKKVLVQTFKTIIARSVGYRSENNRSFVKTEKFRDEFVGTEAFSDLYLQLLSDAEFTAEFMKGILPNNLGEKTQLPADLQDKMNQAGKPKVPLAQLQAATPQDAKPGSAFGL